MKIADARILFVDDEPSLLEIFGHWLMNGEEPCTVDTAADGQEALNKVTGNTYDLLITDMNMPRMNGVSLVRHIVQAGNAPPSIIFVSGFGNVDEREMYGLGVEAFLSKPVSRELLLGTVERALAPRTCLWQHRQDTLPRQSVEIDASDFSDTAVDGGIALGRGGFSAPFTSPAGMGKVSFKCRLAARQTEITGEGYIRWRSKAEGLIGIEFTYLDEPCRAAVIAEIDARNPQAFIPAR